MTDSTLSQAIREAYAAAPAGQVIYHTLELNHPAFSAPIRVVRDYADLFAKLESSAPYDAGTYQNFVRFAFDFTKPDMSATGVPQITITIDNVDRSIVSNIESAMGTADMVTAIYREYLSTDLICPQNDPPIHMTIMTITADVFKVTAVAGFVDLVNRRFPSTAYDTTTFPGLIQ